jgi:hypothetical protein
VDAQVQAKPENTKTDAKAEPGKKKANFMGKINNLVTSDLDNITNGRDFLCLSRRFVILCNVEGGLPLVG